MAKTTLYIPLFIKDGPTMKDVHVAALNVCGLVIISKKQRKRLYASTVELHFKTLYFSFPDKQIYTAYMTRTHSLVTIGEKAAEKMSMCVCKNACHLKICKRNLQKLMGQRGTLHCNTNASILH
jgi:hypothetical protein